ncbi:sulfite exporter TauE/SafE family protein [Salinisphaera orenii]|uniref:Probable membrane transporter protein n=1 Tax=Salinisphaera orenii YIM 95161 TaxID=1051139 RepID=A0A423PTP9_9GAMM|nr:sulfite exporter TauE/SafE family protein [Salinisphaera halophila]ROO28986.1 glutamine amidotransferase [Salinisphaera halophila YIM 95161]
MTFYELVIAFVCLALGGVIKGATGAGAPIFAVPALAMMFDVQFAVVVMLMPNLLTNCWQAWRFRAQRLPARFNLSFAGFGALGVIAGSVVLAQLSPRLLSLIVALGVIAYIGFKLSRPDWFIRYEIARRISGPAGFVAGLLQGASGLSAPVSLSFLNALKLERPYFISTASFFFVAMTAVQIPALATLGLMTPHRLLLSACALVPLAAFMPVGARLARHLPRTVFDRVILAVLGVLAIKLMFDALY